MGHRSFLGPRGHGRGTSWSAEEGLGHTALQLAGGLGSPLRPSRKGREKAPQSRHRRRQRRHRVRAPIGRALEIAADSEYEGADLVLITDELCRVNEEFVEDFLAEKERRKMHLFSVLIGYSSSGELGRYSDQVWTLTDLAGPATWADAASEVFGLIQE